MIVTKKRILGAAGFLAMVGNETLRLGLWGARMDTGGLAAQTFEYYNWLKPHKIAVIDISALNGYPQFPEKYLNAANATYIQGFPTKQQIRDFLKDLDVVLTVESAYDYYLFDAARRKGVKTAHVYNFEFLDYLRDKKLPKPTMLLSPSSWHNDEVKQLAKDMGVAWRYLQVPVNREKFPFRMRSHANSFLHIAGHVTYEDRNGTNLVLEAIPYVKSDVTFTIRAQYPLVVPNDSRITVVRAEKPDHSELYENESVLLLPRRYGGLSLQLNEALSQGIIPIMTDIAPQNEFLPSWWLVESRPYKQIMTRTLIDCYHCTPQALAKKIDYFAAQPGGVIRDWSCYASSIANWIDWRVMLTSYTETLSRCMKL